MRTVGKFSEIYKQAREYNNGVDISHIPSDPVVRLENGKWIIESRLEPQQETVVEASLDDFQSYWYESFEDENYTITKQNINDYIKFVEETGGMDD